MGILAYGCVGELIDLGQSFVGANYRRSRFLYYIKVFHYAVG